VAFGKSEVLAPGLYMVATPIGNARDITLRALDTLAAADILAAEDTRSLRKLLQIHGIQVNHRPLVAYHDHNGSRMRPRLLAALAEGKSVAYASEAGTPAISDPGMILAQEAQAAGHRVTAAPGVSAAVTALSVAGLPTDRFLFAGFLPSAEGARRAVLQDLSGLEATLVFYESPHRIAATLADACGIMGKARPAALCRELTKRFEEVVLADLGTLAETAQANPPKGEIVLLIGKGRQTTVSETEIESALDSALQTMSVRDAASVVSQALGVRRRQVYQIAMTRTTGKG
jgi:16S rRNA (cytidine1402-2'-O)-methyltransferase